jgi:hypothetical protein
MYDEEYTFWNPLYAVSIVLLAGGAGIAQSVSVATDCAAKFRFPTVETIFFTSRLPEPFWGPPSPLFGGYRLFFLRR